MAESVASLVELLGDCERVIESVHPLPIHLLQRLREAASRLSKDALREFCQSEGLFSRLASSSSPAAPQEQK